MWGQASPAGALYLLGLSPVEIAGRMPRCCGAAAGEAAEAER